MSEQLSFIEQQFPVSKISKESYKERKSSQGQTITGMGKWWGRKPLVLIRAVIIGCLLPASDNPAKDMDVFLKIMSMDKTGLYLRKDKTIPTKTLYEYVIKNRNLKGKYEGWFEDPDGKIKLSVGAPKAEIEKAVFDLLGYDDKIALCLRPEQITNEDEMSWKEINLHLGTQAQNLRELVKQLSIKRYWHELSVGDCFCGGGSVPFEAARIGCNAYASDLNPIAGLLTWADLNICGINEKERRKLEEYQKKIYDLVDKEICDLGIEENERGDRAHSYLYCMETTCPECNYVVPMLPSCVVGVRAGRVIAKLNEANQAFDIDIISDVSTQELKEAQNNGTVKNNSLICPHCGRSTPISSIRHDYIDEEGHTVYGLRMWNRDEFASRDDDVFRERLYAIRYETSEGKRYYCKPSERDLENERKVKTIVSNNLTKWQEEGLIPSSKIEDGYNTDQIIRERGWSYWHQLFSARQLLVLSRFVKYVKQSSDQRERVVGMLGINKMADFGSDLCRWNPNCDKTEQTFYNQALNTMFNWGVRSLTMLSTLWFRVSECEQFSSSSEVFLTDARNVTSVQDYWITDPPYADAVNYHELSEFFLAWDKSIIKDTFSDWYADSKRVLAVRGDSDFSHTMIDIYSNLTTHMNDDGMQVVMFTHSDPAVWAQLAIIMWKSGLKVTAAWNIATETEAVGLKNGNYVKGTVILVLRKQKCDDIAFLDEINADIRNEVKKQIESMQQLDDKEEPNFSDPDYVLAAYAASLKVLTSYASIEDLDLDYELNQAITNPTKSKVVTIIENAKKIAYDCVIPLEFDNYLWRDLSNAEKFYIKGLESEKHGDYQIGTYQEFARGFSIAGYSQMMANEKANTARLKTPVEMAGRTISDVPDFEHSIMRTIFEGIYVGVKEDNNPNKALGFIKSELQNYWDKREMIQQMLRFLVDIKDISNMQDHWGESSEMADLLLTLVSHDSV